MNAKPKRKIALAAAVAGSLLAAGCAGQDGMSSVPAPRPAAGQTWYEPPVVDNLAEKLAEHRVAKVTAPPRRFALPPPPRRPVTYRVPDRPEALDRDNPVGAEVENVWDYYRQGNAAAARRVLERDLLPKVLRGGTRLRALAALLRLAADSPKAMANFHVAALRLDRELGFRTRVGDPLMAAVVALSRAKRGKALPADTPKKLKAWLNRGR